jgi:hypothetical protein
MENRKIVILDGCFYHRKQIAHLYDNLPHRHFAFTLKAPVEVCIQRDRGRELVFGEEAARAVHEMVSGFDEGIVIDTDGKTLAQTVEEITSHLPL